MSELPTSISPDEREALAHAVKGCELAHAAQNSLVSHLLQKYQIQPPDQLTVDGRIIRVAKDEPQNGTKAAHRRGKFGKAPE